MTPEDVKYWNLSDIMQDSDLKIALLILNRPILLNVKKMLALWDRAVLRITVDGGSDQWLKFIKENKVEDRPSPHLITGDLDSVSPSTLEHFRTLGTQVVHTPDQDETDFTKALRAAATWIADKNIMVDAVIVIAEMSGRLDHIMANLNTLFYARSLLSSPVYQLASDSISWLLEPGFHHSIEVPAFLADGCCSLVPLGQPCSCVTTTGLKWNLDKRRLQFGHLVSTSNTYVNKEGGCVTVDTDETLLWTMEIK